MNRDEIIRMAQEAHGPITGQWWDMDAAALERFYRAAFAAGAAAEREACAKVCDEIAQRDETGYGIAEDCAAAIRAALAQAEPVAWLRVIDEAMVTHHLTGADPADDYETAKRKMDNLLTHARAIGAYFASEQQAEPVQRNESLAQRRLRLGRR